jgi:hypothetical protein
MAAKWFDGRGDNNSALLSYIHDALKARAEATAKDSPEQNLRTFSLLVWVRARHYDDTALLVAWHSVLELSPVRTETNAECVEAALRSRVPPSRMRAHYRDPVNSIAEAPLEQCDLLMLRVRCACELRDVAAFDTLPMLLEVLVDPTSTSEVCTLHANRVQGDDLLRTLCNSTAMPAVLNGADATKSLATLLQDKKRTLAPRLRGALVNFGGDDITKWVLEQSEPPQDVRRHPALVSCALRCSHSDSAMPGRSIARLHELYVYADRDGRPAEALQEVAAALSAVGVTETPFNGTVLFSQVAARTLGTERAPPLGPEQTNDAFVQLNVELTSLRVFPSDKASPDKAYVIRPAPDQSVQPPQTGREVRVLQLATQNSIVASTHASDASTRFRRLRVLDSALLQQPAGVPISVDTSDMFLAAKGDAQTVATDLCKAFTERMAAIYLGVLLFRGTPPELHDGLDAPRIALQRDDILVAMLLGRLADSKLQPLIAEWIDALVGRLALGVLAQGPLTYPDGKTPDFKNSGFTHGVVAALTMASMRALHYNPTKNAYADIAQYRALLHSFLPALRHSAPLQQLLGLALATNRRVLLRELRYPDAQ